MLSTGDAARSLGAAGPSGDDSWALPQSQEVCHARSTNAGASQNRHDHELLLRQETEDAVRWQDEIGIDVPVHGEFERGDIVRYLSAQLTGNALAQHGWIQSDGSRYVRPPIIYGDVARPAPMTVAWPTFAQSPNRKPVKGMLVDPVTMLQWSFVRDDIPGVIPVGKSRSHCVTRSLVCRGPNSRSDRLANRRFAMERRFSGFAARNISIGASNAFDSRRAAFSTGPRFTPTCVARPVTESLSIRFEQWTQTCLDRDGLRRRQSANAPVGLSRSREGQSCRIRTAGGARQMQFGSWRRRDCASVYSGGALLGRRQAGTRRHAVKQQRRTA